MGSNFYHKGARGRAEKLVAEIIKMFPCVHCGSPHTDPAHLFQRNSAATCTDLRCIAPLCREYHGYIDTNPVKKEAFARTILGDEYDYFNRLSKSAVKYIDWEARIDFLKLMKQGIKDNNLTLEMARFYEK